MQNGKIMDAKLKEHQTVIVTGASSGIGLPTAMLAAESERKLQNQNQMKESNV
jgi:NADP-dependent 3-hydroxy acid dehydrogenase YdfG